MQGFRHQTGTWRPPQSAPRSIGDYQGRVLAHGRFRLSESVICYHRTRFAESLIQRSPAHSLQADNLNRGQSSAPPRTRWTVQGGCSTFPAQPAASLSLQECLLQFHPARAAILDQLGG